MAHGKFQKSKKHILPVILLLLALIALGSATGGVAAYLSASPEKPLTNTFTVAATPQVIVEGTKVTVISPDCPVYLRVAVAVNKANGSNLVAGISSAEVTTGGWTKGSDGFFYFSEQIQGTRSLELTLSSSSDDIRITAQVIQALGTTDEGDVPAKTYEWHG